MVLQNETIDSFWFDALSIFQNGFLPCSWPLLCFFFIRISDPFSSWERHDYVEEHFKEGASIEGTQYIVPLFLSARKKKTIVCFIRTITVLSFY